jgi:hypothetical protein
MAKHVKKTDQNKAWNRRTGNARAYDLESRAANAKRFLIICEGVNTEPCYFKSFPVQTAQVEAFGIGRSKTSLVEHAIEWVQQKPPDSEREVWVVFDMDFDPSEDATLQPIVNKVWSFCNTLRDDGVGYGDYLEQLTYLLFLKMADEYSKPPYNRPLPSPRIQLGSLRGLKRGAELETTT